MERFSKRSALLAAAAIAVCALTMPSMTSAASWGPALTEHTLHSSDVAITGATIQTTCDESTLTGDVSSNGALLTITSATFKRCTTTGSVGTCTTTATATGFPWQATAVTTNNIQLHRVHIDFRYENHPGSSACAANGAFATAEGTLTNGHWTGNGVNEREIVFSHVPGLTLTSALGNQAVSWVGTFRDTANTLTVTG
jgi:hypothetical protein